MTSADCPGRASVEFGPGVGKTAEILLAANPAQYRGVDVHDDPNNPLHEIIRAADDAQIVIADSKDTGLPSDSATLVVGEAMLTMQSDKDKLATMSEAHRLLRPGGRYAIHEMAFVDQTPAAVMAEVNKTLSRTIKVGARPLTTAGWTGLLEQAGFEVVFSTQNKMALLEISRLIQDEGWLGLFRIAKNVAKNPAARKRILQMRSTFKANRKHLCAVGLVAVKR